MHHTQKYLEKKKKMILFHNGKINNGYETLSPDHCMVINENQGNSKMLSLKKKNYNNKKKKFNN